MAAHLHADIRGNRSRLRAARRTQANEWLRAWTDSLLERELMLAGNLLDCSHCSARLWYRSRDVGQMFSCARCDATSVVPAAAVRSFRLNEAFFSFRDQGGHAVTFALARLRRAALQSFLYYPETSVTRGSSREIDAAVLIDGRLALVEAKTNNSVSAREVEFYVAMARRTRAKSLIFATTALDRNLCGAPKCPCRNEEHRDYAWDDGARGRIARARAELSTHGTTVESWCHELLVVEPVMPDLAPFERRS